MGIRFRRSKQIMPGVSVNISKSSAGVRLGGKGAGVTVNTKGQVTTSVGLPGTGVSYTETNKIGNKNFVDPSPESKVETDNANQEELMQQVYSKMAELDAQKKAKQWRAAKICWIIAGICFLFLLLVILFIYL